MDPKENFASNHMFLLEIGRDTFGSDTPKTDQRG